jgi:hypothetical protein
MKRPDETGGGGMTGATGDLTPAESDDAFIPGERREIAGDEERARVTQAQGASAPAQLGETGDPGTPAVESRGPTNLAERESGYGSQHGLSPDDPAYRMEQHPPAPAAGPHDRETRIGGDELADHEEHL